MIQSQRIHHYHGGGISSGDYVLYWMQASQRGRCNHALEYAIEQADEMGKPVLVYFGIMDGYPGANGRHYTFMLEGITEVRDQLRERGIAMVISREQPWEGALRLSGRAVLLVGDRGYTAHQRRWRAILAEKVACPYVEVESDVVVPVDTVSRKEEYAAATIRPKLRERLPYFLETLEEREPRRSSLDLDIENPGNLEEVTKALAAGSAVTPVSWIRGGTGEALSLLRHFIDRHLNEYGTIRNDPARDMQSQMSPYLHFGQVSPLTVAMEVKKAGGAGVDAYLEELIVRRELSMSHAWHNPQYDSYGGLPRWAAETLEKHGKDRRDPLYSLRELEEAGTHDPYWNAAQKEVMVRGKMHGYMRMYWGKKILEWSSTPREAFTRALYLNDTYELDGRGPNGCTGIAWCFGKHDRPWKERAIFGTVRYMNARGLERKFDIDAYVTRVKAFEKSEK